MTHLGVNEYFSASSFHNPWCILCWLRLHLYTWNYDAIFMEYLSHSESSSSRPQNPKCPKSSNRITVHLHFFIFYKQTKHFLKAL